VIRYMRFGPVGLGVILAVLTVCAPFVAFPFSLPPSDRPPGYAISWVVAGSSFLLVSLWFSLSHARVEVDRDVGTLTLARVRWPLRAQRRTFSLSRILDAEVLWHDDPEALGFFRCTIVLVVEGEGEVSLLDRWETDRARLERLAAAIRAALPNRHADSRGVHAPA
jgi:hypothetical protein